MPWHLQEQKPSGEFCSFNRLNVDYVLGRRECDICIEDKSISRQHCTFTISSSDHSIRIQDKSKYGIRFLDPSASSDTEKIIGGIVFTTNKPRPIALYFGLVSAAFHLTWHSQPTVCISGISSAERKRVVDQASRLGLALSNEWSDACDYLVMPRLLVTEKVLRCLISGRLIVSPDWLFASPFLLQAAKDFLPKVELSETRCFSSVDVGLIFHSRKERSKLLSNLNFLFWDAEQMARLERVVTAAGGHVFFATKEVSDYENFIPIRPKHPMAALHGSDSFMNDEEKLTLAILYCDTSSLTVIRSQPRLPGLVNCTPLPVSVKKFRKQFAIPAAVESASAAVSLPFKEAQCVNSPTISEILPPAPKFSSCFFREKFVTPNPGDEATTFNK